MIAGEKVRKIVENASHGTTINENSKIYMQILIMLEALINNSSSILEITINSTLGPLDIAGMAFSKYRHKQ